MNINEILAELDKMLENCEIERAGAYLAEQTDKALSSSENSAAITLLNEQIGYFRDCGKFKESLAACEKVLALIRKCGLESTPEHATTLLNAANAYRAAGLHDEAFKAYEKVKEIYDQTPDTAKTLYASYYNNLSLLYQETGDFENAAECQKKALAIVTELGDEQKIAISRTNLAVSLIRLGNIADAEKQLNSALGYFIGLTPSDFHYSAALSAMGDVKFHLGEYVSAAQFYEMALSETQLHMGHSNFYDIIAENLRVTREKLPPQGWISGLELCRRFYESFGRPMIHRNFRKYENRIVCGMVGEGSDCLGFDDELSHDHDFGAAFCIWLDDDLYSEIGEKLQKAYDLLPKTFMGYTRVKSPQSRKRTGVFSASGFYTDLLEVEKLPETLCDWLSISPEKLATVTNGEIFSNGENTFTQIRRLLKREYTFAARLKHIAQQTALIAQSGQYNLPRAINRGDLVTAHICFGEFLKSALRCQILIEGRYYPYSKWLFKSCENAEIKALLSKSAALPIEKWSSEIIKPVCAVILAELCNSFALKFDSDYLGSAAEIVSMYAASCIENEKLAYRIAEMEFKAFDKVINEGGRADCQDDWETFSIMRVSQYLTWNTPMLTQYINDFEKAMADGRNPITEKYARMMQSTAPEEYAKIEGQLPELEADSVRICNAVCEIQVGWMEEFAREYPVLASNARAIHTYEDTEWSTSYETYLRGELLTYSRTMLRMYSEHIVAIARENRNLAKMTMGNTVRLYGYTSLDEAERES